MTDRKKVIKGLEYCTTAETSDDCKRCPYDGQCGIDPCALERDALVLLKEQEARVLTPEEIKAYDGYAWGEHGKIMYVSLIKDGLLYDIGEPAYDVEKLNWPYYGKGWRYWSACPTDEQRKAVKWDD